MNACHQCLFWQGDRTSSYSARCGALSTQSYNVSTRFDEGSACEFFRSIETDGPVPVQCIVDFDTPFSQNVQGKQVEIVICDMLARTKYTDFITPVLDIYGALHANGIGTSMFVTTNEGKTGPIVWKHGVFHTLIGAIRLQLRKVLP